MEKFEGNSRKKIKLSRVYAPYSSLKNELQPQSDYKEKSDGISTGIHKWNRTDIQKQMQVYTELNLANEEFQFSGKKNLLDKWC